MVNIKQFLISLLLPFTVIIIIPLVLLFFLGSSQYLINTNIFLLFLGIIILTLGFLLFIKCVILFYRKGEGTLMPISRIHTQKLVIQGPYKYVRHPMIIAVIVMLFGESLIFESFALLIYALSFFLVNIIYLPLVEEKGLLNRFGDDFRKYKDNVPAWFPRITSFYLKEKN